MEVQINTGVPGREVGILGKDCAYLAELGTQASQASQACQASQARPGSSPCMLSGMTPSQSLVVLRF